MSVRVLLFTAILAASLSASFGARIIFLFAGGNLSHKMGVWPLVLGLADRSHQITFVSSHPKTVQSHPNVTDIAPEVMTRFTASLYNVDRLQDREAERDVMGHYAEVSVRACKALLNARNDSQLSHIIDHGEYDLAIVNSIFGECGILIASYHGWKFIEFSTTTIIGWYHHSFGLPWQASYIPDMSYRTSYPLGFVQRVRNVLEYFKNGKRGESHSTELEELMKERFGLESVPSFVEMERNASLVFYSAHHAIDYARPLTPMFIPIGGMQCWAKVGVLSQVVDDCIFAFFAIEMCIKCIAMGIAGNGTYLADKWNWLDCFIVFAGLVEYCIPNVDNVNISAIRTVRVLRPLRAINRIPSMRILVMLLLDTLPMLGNVLLLCFFVFFIFGIIGVQLWSGTLRQRCYIDRNATITGMPTSLYFRSHADSEKDYICSLPKDNGMHFCDDLPPTRNEYGEECKLEAKFYNPRPPGCINWNQYYTDCRAGEKNPFQGAISFDNIGLAWVAIFLVISLEGWTDIMYYVQDAHSFWDWIYFTLLIVIGSFFMINLCLVVIATQFSETKKRELERMRIERARFTSTSTLTAVENASCYSEMFKLVAHWIRKGKRKFRRQLKRKDCPESQIDLGVLRESRTQDALLMEKETQKERHRTAAAAAGGGRNQLTCPQLLAISGALGALPQVALGAAKVKGLPAWDELSTVLKSKPHSWSAPMLPVTSVPGTPSRRTSSHRSRKSSLDEIWGIESRSPVDQGPCGSAIRDFVENKWFQQGILCAILINTMSMGVEHHNQSQSLTTAVEVSNIFFSSIFFLEMLLKLLAYGCVGYMRNGFDVFDGIIVILSGVELFQGIIEGNVHGGGALSVLRTFRLLRILKLVRFMPNLRRQLVVMLKTMDNVAVFCALLLLFIFIFSILGMNLFGCKFCVSKYPGSTEKVCDRKNFDSLLWSLITVFQILTQEDWNHVLFNGMEKTSPWAALYFVALMTFGNYVLFNLLVAILVEGFSSERVEREQREKEAEERERAASELRSRSASKLALNESPHHFAPGPSKSSGSRLLVPVAASSSAVLPPAPIIITYIAPTPEGSPLPPLSNPGSKSNLGSPQVSYTSLNSAYHYLAPTHIEIDVHAPQSPNGFSKHSLSPFTSPNMSPRSLSPLSLNASPVRSPHLKRARSWREEKDQRRKERRASLSPNLKMNEYNNYNNIHNNNNNIHSSSWCESRCASVGDSPPSVHTVGSVKFKPFKEKCQEAMNWMKEHREYSCFIFPAEHKFRQRCMAIVEHPAFDRFILLLIALNCITLAMERPSIPPDSPERYFLQISNDLFSILFLIEMSLKVTAQGGFAQYFESGWNVMDGLLVMVSVIDQVISFFMNSPKIFGILRVFRLLRSLRPLRVINRAPGLKLVVQTLMSSLRPIGNIVLICITFFMIFGILGVQLFKGTFYYCTGPNLFNVTTKWNCEDQGNTWVNRKYNFDDLGQALMALFVLSSKDGWVGIMYSGLDAVDVDKQPQENHNEWRLLYFISFLLLVGFFVLNMFVGVVVENFHRCREEQEKEERAMRAAKRLRKMEKRRRKMREPPYWINYSRWRLRIHGLVTSKYFDLAIAGIIGLNVVTMAMEFYMMPEELKYILKIFNYFFTNVFILEGSLKLSALGAKRYLRSKWNQLDILIVILSVVGIILEKMESDLIPINPTIMRVMRVLRIARVLKLLKMAGGIRALLDTVVQALPQVGNLGLLFFLLFFIFAALGVELFGKLACDEKHPCEGLGEHANFVNFGMAYLTLFRVATGDNWNGIMKDTLREDCDDSVDCFQNCCVSHIVAPLYFVVFVLMAQFVLVNVVVAVLMKHLEESHKQMEDDLDIELELEAELAAQEEIILKEEKSDIEPLPPKYLRLPKVVSLPDNFVYSYFEPDDNYSNS